MPGSAGISPKLGLPGETFLRTSGRTEVHALSAFLRISDTHDLTQGAKPDNVHKVLENARFPAPPGHQRISSVAAREPPNSRERLPLHALSETRFALSPL